VPARLAQLGYLSSLAGIRCREEAPRQGILKGGLACRHLAPLSDQAIELLRGLMIDGKLAVNACSPGCNRWDLLGASATLKPTGARGWSDRTTTHASG
jgi:hypothetical protein